MNLNQKIIKFKFLRDIWKIVSKWIYEKMKNELLQNGTFVEFEMRSKSSV